MATLQPEDIARIIKKEVREQLMLVLQSREFEAIVAEASRGAGYIRVAETDKHQGRLVGSVDQLLPAFMTLQERVGRLESSTSPERSCSNANDFFGASPLQGVPEVNGCKMQEMLHGPKLLANNISQQMMLTPRGNMQIDLRCPAPNPYAIQTQSPPLRRTTSNRLRRNRRVSAPEVSRNCGWPQTGQYPARNGSFIGTLPPDSFGETGADDAFLPNEYSSRSSNGMKELEILCRFGEIGIAPGQMNAPHGFCLGRNNEVIVADTNNHRIQFFDQSGQFLDIWGKPGKRDGQLWFPRKVAWMPKTNRVVVCDRGQDRSRLQIFTRDGQHETTINVDYVAIVAGMTVFDNQIVIVDSVNPTCLILKETPATRDWEVTFWFSCAKNMKEPSDVVVAHRKFFICDFKGHCVCAYDGQGKFVNQIGDNTVINFPNGIDVTDRGDVLIGDSHGNRFHVAVYAHDTAQFLGEYECPHMKVSRCCGLVLTPENHLVTIAKNNNFVLILERLDVNLPEHNGPLSALLPESEDGQGEPFKNSFC